MQKFIAIIGMILGVTGVHAQSLFSVKGQVRENDTRINGPFALIRINQTVIYADVKGVFTAEIPQADAYQVEVSQIGFETGLLNLASADLETIDLELKPKMIFLEEVLINRTGSLVHLMKAKPRASSWQIYGRAGNRSKDCP